MVSADFRLASARDSGNFFSLPLKTTCNDIDADRMSDSSDSEASDMEKSLSSVFSKTSKILISVFVVHPLFGAIAEMQKEDW